MGVLTRLFFIPIYFVAMFIMILPFFIFWIILGIDDTNKIMDKVMKPILDLC